MEAQKSEVGVAPGLVVGLGASAGGLEAFRVLLAEMPTGTGIAERVMGIEPTLAAWEAAVLPLNYTRARAPV